MTEHRNSLVIPFIIFIPVNIVMIYLNGLCVVWKPRKACEKISSSFWYKAIFPEDWHAKVNSLLLPVISLSPHRTEMQPESPSQAPSVTSNPSPHQDKENGLSVTEKPTTQLYTPPPDGGLTAWLTVLGGWVLRLETFCVLFPRINVNTVSSCNLLLGTYKLATCILPTGTQLQQSNFPCPLSDP
jgi:hypothetical protein